MTPFSVWGPQLGDPPGCLFQGGLFPGKTESASTACSTSGTPCGVWVPHFKQWWRWHKVEETKSWFFSLQEYACVFPDAFIDKLNVKMLVE